MKRRFIRERALFYYTFACAVGAGVVLVHLLLTQDNIFLPAVWMVILMTNTAVADQNYHQLQWAKQAHIQAQEQATT